MLAKRPRRLARLVSRATAKAGASRPALHSVWRELQCFLRLLGAWRRKEYRDIPWQSITLIIGAVVYFVNPFDAIPDWLAGVGLVDDALLLGWVASALRGDLDRFRQWERRAEAGWSRVTNNEEQA